RVARRSAPASRVEVVWASPDATKPSNDELAEDETSRRPEGFLHGWSRRRGDAVLEIPIRCGAAAHGRLRLHGPSRGRWALTPATQRRLTTVCTMACCALENVRRQAEWSWQSPDPAPGDHRPRDVVPDTIDTRIPLELPAAVVRDATFLNAV